MGAPLFLRGTPILGGAIYPNAPYWGVPTSGCSTSRLPPTQGYLHPSGFPSLGYPILMGSLQIKGTSTSGVTQQRGAPYLGAPPQSVPPQGYLHFRGTSPHGYPHLRGAPYQCVPPQGYFQIMVPPLEASHLYLGVLPLRLSHLMCASTSGMSHLRGTPVLGCSISGCPDRKSVV